MTTSPVNDAQGSTPSLSRSEDLVPVLSKEPFSSRLQTSSLPPFGNQQDQLPEKNFLEAKPITLRKGNLSATLTPIIPKSEGRLAERIDLVRNSAGVFDKYKGKHGRSTLHHSEEPSSSEFSSCFRLPRKRAKKGRLSDPQQKPFSSSSKIRSWVPPLPDLSLFGETLGTGPVAKSCPPTPVRPRLVRGAEAKKLEAKFKNVNRALSMIALKIPEASVGRGNFCFALRVRNLDQLLPYIRDAIADDDKFNLLESHLEAHKADYIVIDTTSLCDVRILKTFHDQSALKYSAKFRETIISNHMNSYERGRALGIPCAVYDNNPKQDLFYIQEYLPVGLDNHPTFSAEIRDCSADMTNLSAGVRSILDQCKAIVIKGFRGNFSIDASADGGNFRMRGNTVVCSDFFEIDVGEHDEPVMKMIETVRILSRGANPRNTINRSVYDFFRSEAILRDRLLPYDEI